MDDTLIAELLTCKKTITNPRARFKTENGADQKNFTLVSDDGKRFQIYLRQNTRIKHDFSCGIIYLSHGGTPITLARYNGGSHVHANPIEGVKFAFVCHIHRATERYIQAGKKPAHYAEQTDRYSDLNGALLALVLDCNVMGLPGVAASNETNGDLFAND